jgi:glucuronate isomerase
MLNMTFIHDDFMLQNETAKYLYHHYAKDLPIFDYHCHLSPELIANNHLFKDITELWLAGDHYKWRAMRANGIAEDYITGNASNEEKFKAWAETVEASVGNPLYHWTHLELKRYFGMDELLSLDNWKTIYDQANKVIKERNLTTQKLIELSKVTYIGTTDHPIDSLKYHQEIHKNSSLDTKVSPSFRPDDAFLIGQNKFDELIKELDKLTQPISNYHNFIDALEKRVDYFNDRGALISDHGFGKLLYAPSTDDEIDIIFRKALNKTVITEDEYAKYFTRLFVDLGKLYHSRHWVMQIHFGAIRNTNTKMLELIGRDAGFDSIDDQINLAYSLNHLLDALAREEALPKTIIYNLNPMVNDLVASTIANFQGNNQGIKGKIQFGAGWWFNDTEQGMLRQLSTLADHGLLMHFVGMLTDSRSFVSYSRHEYFRRIFCNYLGEQVELGKIPNDEKLLKKIVENICYKNAERYFKK